MPPKKNLKMGTKALSKLKIASVETAPNNIVTELITEKYQSRLSLCMERMLYRRLSRESTSSTDDGFSGGFSSNYSSRVGTPDSVCSGRSYFSLCYHSRRDNTDVTATSTLFHDTKSTFSLRVPTTNAERLFGFRARKNTDGKRTFPFVNLQETTSSSFQIKDCTKDVQDLKKALTVQNGIIAQISKALSYCKGIKSARNSDEYLEAERILLVAIVSRDAIAATLTNLEFGHEFYSEFSTGIIEISGIHFFSETNSRKDKMTEYVVMVISCGQNVLSSQPLTANKDGEIIVDSKFRFEDLPDNFQINVTIYTIFLKSKKHKLSKYSKLTSKAASKYSINQDTSTGTSSAVSSFQSIGNCVIKISDIDKTHFSLENVPNDSSLHSTFIADIKSNVKLNIRRNGFLTVGIEQDSSLLWKRRWCVLEGRQLKLCSDTKKVSESLEVIELENCTTNEISSSEIFPADRITCPKAKSLVLSIKDKRLVKKYFLFPDTSEDMALWHNDLNSVINSLRSWNCLKELSETLI